MNIFVANPDWGWWIIGYFFLGGIAAGAYFLALLIDLLGRPDSRELARVGYWIAFPLVMICGLLLTVDLERPERFWHMLFRSEVVHEALDQGWPFSGAAWSTMAEAPLLKRWSPMSVGSWALVVFGVCSALSFLGSLWPEGRAARWLRYSLPARLLQIVGSLVGFFVAAYTGTLLSATNQPIWSDSVWIAPLFLTSAASTGAAAMLLLARFSGVGAPAVERLEQADVQALLLEALVFTAFLVSLGEMLGPVWATWHGKLLVAGTAVVALLLPLGLHLAREWMRGEGISIATALLVLVGGLLVRYALLTTPGEILARGPAAVAGLPEQPVGTPGSGAAWLRPVSPEDGRPPGAPGADPGNRGPDLEPRSKVYNQE
jgi:formate-dependent nitrite reductase membrane component NrfD